jgi:hypothetical protein
MKNNHFPQYPQQLEDSIGAISEYLFEKYNDIFNVFHLEEYASGDINKRCSNGELKDK